MANNTDGQKRFIGTVSILLLLIGAGLLLVTSVGGNYLFDTLWRKDFEMSFWPYGFYSVLTAFFNSYFKAATVSLIYMKQPRQFLWLNLLNFLATVGISIGGLYLSPDTLIGPMYGRLLSGALIFVLAHVVFVKNGTYRFDRSFIAELVKFCAPYGVFALCGWILGQIDRFFLQSYISNIELNAYDLLLKCFFGIEFLQNSLSAVIFPKLYEIWTKEKNNTTTPESNRYSNVFTAINIIQLIAFCIVVPVIYKIIIRNETFYEAEKYIGLIAAGYAMRSILNFYLSTILFSKKIIILLKVFGLTSLFQIALTLIAVKYFGLIGAIYTAILTKVLQVIFCSLFTRSVFSYEYNYFKIMVVPFSYIAFNVVQFFIFPGYDLRLYLLQFLLFSILFYLIYKNEIRKVLQSFNLIK